MEVYKLLVSVLICRTTAVNTAALEEYGKFAVVAIVIVQFGCDLILRCACVLTGVVSQLWLWHRGGGSNNNGEFVVVTTAVAARTSITTSASHNSQQARS